MIENIVIGWYYFLNIIFTLLKNGDAIIKRKVLNKIWLDSHCKKVLLQKSKKYRYNKGGKRCKRNKHAINATKSRKQKINQIFKAPRVFSMRDNPDETIKFFNRILDTEHKYSFGTHFYIDSSEVEEVSVDALMYLIAIVNDIKYNKVFQYSFEGNYPRSSTAKKIFIQSGFVNFVNSGTLPGLFKNKERFEIRQGSYTNTTVAGELCKFVQQHCHLTRIDTLSLYPIFIELMSNTRQHAYKEAKSKYQYQKANFWYCAAEKRSDYVKFVFLDTGLGIPTTVKKKATENFSRKLGLNGLKDSELIRSALSGDYLRTETKQHNRGKGLPQITSCFHTGLIKDVFVYSGKGCCMLSEYDQQDYQVAEYSSKLFGTLFSWKVMGNRGNNNLYD